MARARGPATPEVHACPRPVMVPNSASPPPPDPRSLDPEALRELRTVIAQRWREVTATERALSVLIKRIADDARARGLRPEELIIALKAVEEEVLGGTATLRGDDAAVRRRFREWLVSSCVHAYFAP